MLTFIKEVKQPMAFWNRSKVTVKRRNPKTGKLEKVEQFSGSGKELDKMLQLKGMDTKPSKLSNQRDAQMQKHTERMAQIAGRTSNTMAAIGQAGNIVQKALNTQKNVSGNIVDTNKVETLVNGGATEASNQRDEDKEEDTDWVA
jgi:hypothetical protein